MLRNRLIYLGLWILSLVGISFFGGVVSYGIFWALTLLPVVLLVYLILVLFGIKIYQELNIKEVVSRAPVAYYFTLQNESPLAFSSIRVTFFDFGVDYGDLDQNAEYELMPHTGHKISTNIVCKYRGEYDIGVRNIIITDFLGLLKITYKNPGTMKVNVLPAIVYPSQNMLDEQALFASSIVNAEPMQRDILVRKYVTGDSMRLINWKVTAKKRELMVSNMISEEHSCVHMLLDTHRYASRKEEFLPAEDELLTTLITMVLYFTCKHIDVSVHYISGEYRQQLINDMDRFDEFYRNICQLVFDEDTDSTGLLESVKNRIRINDEDVIYLGSFTAGEVPG